MQKVLNNGQIADFDHEEMSSTHFLSYRIDAERVVEFRFSLDEDGELGLDVRTDKGWNNIFEVEPFPAMNGIKMRLARYSFHGNGVLTTFGVIGEKDDLG